MIGAVPAPPFAGSGPSSVVATATRSNGNDHEGKVPLGCGPQLHRAVFCEIMSLAMQIRRSCKCQGYIIDETATCDCATLHRPQGGVCVYIHIYI